MIPWFMRPFFQKPIKVYAIDADTSKPLDPSVRVKTYAKYYTVETGRNGNKRLVGHNVIFDAAEQDGAGGQAKDGNKKAQECKNEKKDNGADAKQNDTGAAWTAEEDEKLKTLKGKAPPVPWLKVAEEVGRPVEACKARWKEIGSTGGNEQGKKDEGKKGDAANQNKGGDQGQKGKGNQGGNNANQGKQGDKQGKGGKGGNDQQKKESKKNEKRASEKGGTRFTMGDWLALQEDDSFSFGELRVISELIARDSERGWQRVASRFFDLTGKRASPDDIREKFESMAAAAEEKK